MLNCEFKSFQRLPDAQIRLWEPGSQMADYAIVRLPKQSFFLEQTQLKAIFNIGAGVDAITKLELPPNVPLIRLNDAGMASQNGRVCLPCHYQACP